MKPTSERVRDAKRTQAAILSSAQEIFATKGYAQAGVREIAGAAGVDPALVRRYFGSKEELFADALAKALDLSDLLATSRDQFGKHIAAYLIDNSSPHANPMPILMMAMADPNVRSLALDMLQHRVIEPLAEWIGGHEAPVRAARVTMICSGFITYVRLLPLEMFSGGIDASTRNWLEQQLQGAIES